jgi:predicted Zn-dependent protease
MKRLKKRIGLAFSLAAALAVLLAACQQTAFTGRSQLSLVPEADLLAMSFQQYDQFLDEHPPVRGTAAAEMVQRVGQRLQAAAERYYAAEGLSDQLDGYAWAFNLVDDPQINAWCMPGGKVVVYAGIMPVAQDEDGLAVVMGHEIAHALARHGAERMSQGLAAQLGGAVLGAALQTESAATQNLFQQAYGVGVQVGALLPFSRQQESEADEIGLYLMAMAGYDPEAAAPFWERMTAAGGAGPPEFLSTHPAPGNRSARLQQLVPKARDYARRY